MLFEAVIEGWDSWEAMYQDKTLFAPLVREMLERHGLRYTGIDKAFHASNAVFLCGEYIVKIAAPEEVGFGDISEEEEESMGEMSAMLMQFKEDDAVCLGDIETEVFATARANRLGVASMELIAEGTVEDKYRFDYLITRFIKGVPFKDKMETMTEEEKLSFAKELRKTMALFNTPSEDFKKIRGFDILRDPSRHRRWSIYPQSFREERMRHVFSKDYGERVMVHGDLNGGNILLDDKGMYIIDFADCVLAPVIYEHAMIAVELFSFDTYLLKGFFGDISREELTDICVEGLLIHDFGADLVVSNIAKAEKIESIKTLRELIWNKLEAFAVQKV